MLIIEFLKNKEFFFIINRKFYLLLKLLVLLFSDFKVLVVYSDGLILEFAVNKDFYFEGISKIDLGFLVYF